MRALVLSLLRVSSIDMNVHCEQQGGFPLRVGDSRKGTFSFRGSVSFLG